MAETIQLPQGIFFKQLGKDGVMNLDAWEFFEGKKVILFALPGAFTPVCTGTQVPSFLKEASHFRDQGIDVIACLSINDPFVMHAWGQSLGALDSI